MDLDCEREDAFGTIHNDDDDPTDDEVENQQQCPEQRLPKALAAAERAADSFDRVRQQTSGQHTRQTPPQLRRQTTVGGGRQLPTPNSLVRLE